MGHLYHGYVSHNQRVYNYREMETVFVIFQIFQHNIWDRYRKNGEIYLPPGTNIAIENRHL